LSILPLAGWLFVAAAPGFAQEGAPAPRPDLPPPAAAPPASAPGAGAAPEESPLDAAERDTLLRLAWRTLAGHLTKQPIQDKDLAGFGLTPRLQQARGCFVTLRIAGDIRGLQGEVDATRPLYQQVIVFTRRAATRDARFLPITDLDLDRTTLEIAVIGKRDRVDAPDALRLEGRGILLEKWGRRAIFLPGVVAAQKWDTERTLEELSRQASLPAGGWRVGARVETFEAELVSGPRPQSAPPREAQPPREPPPPQEPRPPG
jgi:AmmeMemoRadiSam system protein A